MRAVTDPALLEQLEAQAAPTPRPVTDKNLLAQLEGQAEEPSAIGNFARGAWSGLKQLGVGGAQMLAPVANKIGLTEAMGGDPRYLDKTLQQNAIQLQSEVPEGFSGAAGEFVGKVAPFVAALPAAIGTGVSGLAAASGLGSAAQQVFEPQIGDEFSYAKKAKDIGISGATGALIGGVIGKGAQLIGRGAKATTQATKDVAKGIRAKDTEFWKQSLENIGNQRKGLYAAADTKNVVLKPTVANTIAGKISQDVLGDGLLNPAVHPKSSGVFKQVQDTLTGNNITLELIDQTRQLIQDAARNIDKQDARKAVIMLNALDDAVANIGKADLLTGSTANVNALARARSLFAKESSMGRILKIVEDSMDDPVVMKREITKLLKDPRKLRGFTSNEKNIIRRIADTGGVENLLRGLGKVGFDVRNLQQNTFLPLVSSGIGTITGGLGAGAAVPIAGTAARYASGAITRGKVDELLQAIASRNPSLAKSVGGHLKLVVNNPSKAAEVVRRLEQAAATSPEARGPINQLINSLTSPMENGNGGNGNGVH